MAEEQTQLPVQQNQREWFYNQTYVLLEIIKQLNGRETVFLQKKTETSEPLVIRCIKAYTVDFLKKNFEAYRFFKRNFLIYHSVAHLKDMPMMSFHPETAEKQREDINLHFENYFTGYDLVLDIDAKSTDNIASAQKAAIKVSKLFDEYDLPYHIKFSGNKGFHITIDYQYFPARPKKMMSLLRLCAQVANNIRRQVDSDLIDTTIYDQRRIIKTAYTVDTSSGMELVTLPLTDEQLEKFRIDMVKVDNIFRNPMYFVRIKNRGLLERHLDADEAVLRKRVSKFFNDFKKVK